MKRSRLWLGVGLVSLGAVAMSCSKESPAPAATPAPAAAPAPAAEAATAASFSLARRRTSSRLEAASGISSATNSSVGVSRAVMFLPTSARRMPLADSRARAESAFSSALP